MSISILVVDDSRAIAEGFSGKLRRYAREHFSIEAHVEALCESDLAVQRLSDSSKPGFDLLFTDIDFGPGDSFDKSGIALARYARALKPEMPLVGYSGRFDNDDLGDSERDLFDRWWPKGGTSSLLDQLTADALERAIKHKNLRFVENAIQSASVAHGNLDDLKGLDLLSKDDDFLAAGYMKRTIEPSVANRLSEPFAVWERTSEEGIELEVVGVGAIFSWGDDAHSAEENLLEVIHDIGHSISDPDETFAPSMLQAKRFVQLVMGFRQSGEVT